MSNENGKKPATPGLDPSLYNQQVCPILSVATLNSVETGLVGVGGQATKRNALANCVGPRCQFFSIMRAPDGSEVTVGCAVALIARGLMYANATMAIPYMQPADLQLPVTETPPGDN